MCFAQLCKAYHGSFPASSTTALQACSQAKLWGCDDDLIIKGDALNVINALNGISTSVCWRFFDIIDQGRTFCIGLSVGAVFLWIVRLMAVHIFWLDGQLLLLLCVL